MIRRIVLVATIASVFAVITVATQADDKPVEKRADRFDLKVREDIFAGFTGDAERLENGVKLCDETLAKNPKHAEALVWRGAAWMFQSGAKFQAGKIGEGQTLWTTGQKDMDDAVKLEPENVGVRIPRASVMIPASRQVPPAMGKPLLKIAAEDLETIYRLQEKDFATLGKHPQGELRMGLAEVYRRLGDSEKSVAQLEAILKELPKTKYADRATEWLAEKPTENLAHNCIGCHTK